MHARHTHIRTHAHTQLEVVEAVLKKANELIDEDQVEVRPENLPDGVLDENVDDTGSVEKFVRRRKQNFMTPALTSLGV